MSELIEQFIPNREQIERLQEEISKLPQVQSMVTEHFFSDG